MLLPWFFPEVKVQKTTINSQNLLLNNILNSSETKISRSRKSLSTISLFTKLLKN